MPDPLTQVKAWLDAGFDGVKAAEALSAVAQKLMRDLLGDLVLR